MTPQSEKTFARLLPWGSLSPRVSSLLTDLPIAFAGMALFYGLLSLTRYWTAPVNTQAQIDLSPIGVAGLCPVFSRAPCRSVLLSLGRQSDLWIYRRE